MSMMISYSHTYFYVCVPMCKNENVKSLTIVVGNMTSLIQTNIENDVFQIKTAVDRALLLLLMTLINLRTVTN